jgi:DHA2 family multidrug resistance protein
LSNTAASPAGGVAPGQRAAAAAPAQLPMLAGSELMLVTIAIALATFMEVLDTTIVNVSVPAIAGSLGVSPNEGTWTITSYSMAAAIMQPLTGWFGRRFGEVRTFVTSTLLFVCISALCGFANSMPMLVVFRLLQGAVSGPMAPMAQALLMRVNRPEKRGTAMGIWGMVVFVAPIFGPILGGYITDNLSWQWLFYINVPVGLVAGSIVWTLLRKRDTVRTKVPVDITGMLLLFAGVGALQFLLDNGNEMDWFGSWIIVAAGAVSVVGLTLLIAWEMTDRHPVLDLHLFKHHNFSMGLIAMCLGFACFFGATVIFPLFLQTTAGYTATWAGLAMSGVGIVGIFMMPIAGKNLHRMNLRVAATFGFLVLAGGMYWSSTLTADASFRQMIAPRVLFGFGMAYFFMPMQQIMLSDVAPNELAAAAGMSNFLRNVAGSFATALSVWLMSARTDFHQMVLTQHLAPGGNWDAWSAKLAQAGATGEAALMQSQRVVMTQAQTMGTNDVFLVFCVVMVLCVPVIWLARPPFKAIGSGGGGH